MAGPFNFGRRSKRVLATLDPRLQRIYTALIRILNVTLLEGRRTFTQQLKNIRRRVSKTINSRHIPRDSNGAIVEDGLSKACDAAPYPLKWPDRSKDREKQIARFYYMQGAIAAIAHYEDIPLRSGIDWDGDGDFFDQTFDDMPHIEIDEPLADLVLNVGQRAQVSEAFAAAKEAQ
jgi:hypothetical protein